MDDENAKINDAFASEAEQQAAQIEDIVKRKTGFESSKIRISALKK